MQAFYDSILHGSCADRLLTAIYHWSYDLRTGCLQHERGICLECGRVYNRTLLDRCGRDGREVVLAFCRPMVERSAVRGLLSSHQQCGGYFRFLVFV